MRNFERVGGVLVRCKVQGLNQDRLIEYLKNRRIALYDIKKVSNKCMYVSVNLKQSKIFFAITKNLCYNVSRLGYRGKGLPLLTLLKNLGLAIGLVIFVLCSIFADTLVFDIKITGSGKVYQTDVINYLESCGIKKYSSFNAFSLAQLEDKILQHNEHLNFVSCTKRGNTLNVYTVLKEQDVDSLSGKVQNLCSEYTGVIEKIKAYRGTPLFSEGDSVKVGDLLVEGYMMVKEERVQINVIASVVIIATDTYVHYADTEGQEQNAIVFAQSLLGEREIIESVVQCEYDGQLEQYVYTVNTQYRCVQFAG